ncbi:MAG: copper resistance protein CopC [Sphingomonadaceae bacterium]|nr:copper resistance protein CopC [Sphingomonadaceae bacterium]
MRFDRLVLAVAALGLAVPQLAVAHPVLVSSTPAANSTVARPAHINLVFSEKIQASTARFQLVMTSMPGMAAGHTMPVQTSAMMGKDGKSVMVMPKTGLSPGGYELRWMASGDDREVKSGKVAFTVR